MKNLEKIEELVCQRLYKLLIKERKMILTEENVIRRPFTVPPGKTFFGTARCIYDNEDRVADVKVVGGLGAMTQDHMEMMQAGKISTNEYNDGKRFRIAGNRVIWWTAPNLDEKEAINRLFVTPKGSLEHVTNK